MLYSPGKNLGPDVMHVLENTWYDKNLKKFHYMDNGPKKPITQENINAGEWAIKILMDASNKDLSDAMHSLQFEIMPEYNEYQKEIARSVINTIRFISMEVETNGTKNKEIEKGIKSEYSPYGCLTEQIKQTIKDRKQNLLKELVKDLKSIGKFHGSKEVLLLSGMIKNTVNEIKNDKIRA